MSHHKWGDKERPSPSRTLKHCRRCGVICLSRHEVDAHGHAQHWKEYWRGTERLSTSLVPECVLSIDQEIEEAA
jgi:hypothetical protein